MSTEFGGWVPCVLVNNGRVLLGSTTLSMDAKGVRTYGDLS
jgi:hypothetical protein